MTNLSYFIHFVNLLIFEMKKEKERKKFKEGHSLISFFLNLIYFKVALNNSKAENFSIHFVIVWLFSIFFCFPKLHRPIQSELKDTSLSKCKYICIVLIVHSWQQVYYYAKLICHFFNGGNNLLLKKLQNKNPPLREVSFFGLNSVCFTGKRDSL